MTSIALTNKDAILIRIANGDKLSAIAKDFGVSVQNISKDIRQTPEYQDAQLAGIETRLDVAEDGLDDAKDILSLTRAREKLSHTRWLAETIGKSVYSKQLIQVAPVNNVPLFIVVMPQQVGGGIVVQGECKGVDV